MHQLKPPMDDKFVELWEKFKKSVKDGINIEVSSVRNINKLEQQRQKSDKILNELIKNYYIGNNETNFRIFMYETVKKENKINNTNNPNYKILNKITNRLNTNEIINKNTLEKYLKNLKEMKYPKYKNAIRRDIGRIKRRLDRINNKITGKYYNKFRCNQDKREYENIIQSIKDQKYMLIPINDLKRLQFRLEKLKGSIPMSKKREYNTATNTVRHKLKRTKKTFNSIRITKNNIVR
jgi:hypothetical protein